MKNRTLWTAAVFLFVACHGVVSQTRGPLLASFEQSFGVSQGLLGVVAPAATVGLLLSVLALGVNAGRLGVRRGLLAGVGLILLSLTVLSVVGSYRVLVGAFFVQGLGLGAVRALDRPLLGHLYPGARARVFNLYALTWAVGATGGPLFVNAVLAVTDWRVTFLVLLVPLIPVAVIVLYADSPVEMEQERSIDLGAVRLLLRRPAVRGMAAALVLSGSIEGAMFAWFPYYASGFVSQARANLLLSGFLAMYVPGRLLYSYLSDRRPPLDVVLGLGLVGVPLTVAAFTARSAVTITVASLGLGFVVAGFFPTLSAFGVDSAAEYSGPVNAIATGANFVGISAAPVVVGVVAERADVADGMRLLVPAMVGLTLVTALTRRRLGRVARDGAHGV